MKQNKRLTGLTEIQVLENRKLYGDNRLDPPKKESIWKLFLEKFKDPLIAILLMALSLSVFVSVYQYMGGEESATIFLEPAGIFIAIMLAVGISFLFELNANKKFDILNKEGEEQPTKVIRNGNYTSISKQEVVVGDIVVLDTGDEVPADGILIDAVSLMVNESVLTGEPMTRKTVNSREFKEDSTYPSDRVMRGTTVMEGHGTMKVTMVGKFTEYGKVYEGAQIENSVKTPLNIQLDKLSSLITTLSYIVAGLIIVGRMIMFFNQDIDEKSLIDVGQYVLHTVMLAITVIVVAVPEGLPMSVSLSLALSMRRMLTTNNLVRKMHACETMGAATVICTDKTGTLTQNQMRVGETQFYGLGEKQTAGEGRAWQIVVNSIAVNSTANLSYTDDKRIKPLGNPTEAALLLWLNDMGVDYRDVREKAEITAQSAFSATKKFMGTKMLCNDDEETELLMIKGAPEFMLANSAYVDCSEEGEELLTQEKRDEITAKLSNYQSRAMRTLAFAYKIVERGTRCFDDEGFPRVKDLTFLGIVAIHDPIRAEVPAAVKSCLDAGIKVKMVTGDTPTSAIEIGRQIGLWTDSDQFEKNHISGAEFAATNNDVLLAHLEDIKIMSRARPMDKSRLVTLLQQKGEVVAVTGDGTNDAPALNAAQVGLSMGDGTSVAKNASDITIIDNSFSSINKAVLWGRSLYRNIQRFIYFQLTINIAACLIVLIGAFWGVRSPLTITQMLWVNLIMDTFAAIALASLPPDERVMQEKPRSVDANIITREMAVRFISIALVFVGALLGILHIMKCNDITSTLDFFGGNLRLTNEQADGLTVYELTIFFTTFVMLQFWNLFNCKAFKSRKSAFWNLHKCQGFLIVVVVILVGQILITTFGGEMFGTTPITLTDWLVISAVTATTLIIGEFIRLLMYIGRRKTEIKE